MSESLMLVCPQCGGRNRVPVARLREGAHCGRCKAALFDGHPREVDEAGLERHLHQGDLPVLVDFWAPWCGPCRMMAPAYEQAARQLEPEVRLLKLNTEAHQAPAARLEIRSIPTLILFRGGREIARMSGALDARGILGWVRQQL
jgi:thioredoxin 2